MDTKTFPVMLREAKHVKANGNRFYSKEMFHPAIKQYVLVPIIGIGEEEKCVRACAWMCVWVIIDY